MTSRDLYPYTIEDRDTWYEIFEPLFEAMGESLGYLSPHDNATFLTRPYDWEAECDCGHAEHAEAWHAEHDHTPECFNTRLRKLYFGEWNERPYDKKQDLLDEFLAKEDVPTDGCMLRCDCGMRAQAETYFAAHPHAATCRLDQPNFLHKPTGYAITIYKYAFRESRANMNLTPAAVRAIVADCMDSLNPKEPIQ